MQNQSEVAILRQKIEQETEAMHNGLYGIAAVAKHETITQRYNILGGLQKQLAAYIGDEPANTFVAETYIEIGKKTEAN